MNEYIQPIYSDDYVHDKLHCALGIIQATKFLTDSQLKFAKTIVDLMVESITSEQREPRPLSAAECLEFADDLSKEDRDGIDEAIKTLEKERQISPEQLFRRMTK